MPSDSESSQTKRTSRLILLSVCLGQCIVGLDQRAITVALPTLTTQFHSAFTSIQWTLLIYDLVLIGLIITMGRIGDLYGRRRFYSIGFLIFVSASALCGSGNRDGVPPSLWVDTPSDSWRAALAITPPEAPRERFG